MVHEKCRSELYTYRTGEGELEQVTRFAVPEEKVSSSDNDSKIRDFAPTPLCYDKSDDHTSGMRNRKQRLHACR